MAGRALTELLRTGPSIDSVRAERSEHRVATDTASGRYEVKLYKSRVGTTEYVDYTETTR